MILPTGIQFLNRAGISDRAISKIIGHKNLATLRNYGPGASVEQKLQMADQNVIMLLLMNQRLSEDKN